MSTRIDIAEITEADLGEVAAFLFREGNGRDANEGERSDATARLTWLLRDNPARLDDVPLGWAMRDDRGGGVVGAKVCVPMRLAWRDGTCTALMSAKYYVNEAHRGAGLGLFMRYLKLARRFGLLCTTAGEASGGIWRKFAAYEIPNHEHEMIGVANRSALLEEAAWRLSRRQSIARIAALLPLTGGMIRVMREAKDAELVPLASADDIRAMNLPEGPEHLTALRDRAFLHWRHFSFERHDVFALRRSGRRACLIIVGQSTRGYRFHIRALNVLDFYGAIGPGDVVAMAAAVARRYEGKFDMLIVRSQRPERQAELARIGFRRRTFPVGLALCIDKHNLLPTRDWYLMPADDE